MYLREEKETWLSQEKTKTGGFKARKRSHTIFYFQCDNCACEFKRGTTKNSNIPSMDRKRANNDYKHFCNECKDYGNFAKIGNEIQIKNLENRIGEKKLDSHGYIQVYVGPASSDKCLHKGLGHYCGSVREHILVMTEHIGRPIKKGEVVHHIDGIKSNNSIDNLQLMSVDEHNACHASNDALILKMYRQGLVGYNRETKKYYLK